MLHWNVVAAGFDPANESINFGTRVFAQSDKAVFETNTLATISTDKSIPHNFVPRCKSRFFEQGIGICIGETFHLFDKSCRELILTKHFEAPVTCFDFVTEDGYVVIYLEGGTLAFVNFKTGDDLRVPFVADMDGQHEVNGISPTIDGHSVLIFLSSGKTYECRFVQTGESTEHESDTDKSPSVKLLHNHKSTRSKVSEVFIPCEGETGYFETSANFIRLTESHQGSRNFVSLDSLGDGIVIEKLLVSRQGSYVGCLTSEGKLFNLCPHTGAFIGQHPENCIKDAAVVDQEVGNSFTTCLMMLCEGDGPEIVMTDIHGAETVFRLKVSRNVFIVDNQSGVEDYLFVEYLDGKIRMKSIVDEQPQFRLSRLIQRGKFKEAMEFAEAFDLNKEEVYKGEVRSLGSSLYLSFKFSDAEMNSNLDTILERLAMIADDDFVVEFCVSSMASDMMKIQKLMDYAVDRASAASSRKEEMLDKALSIQLRLGTYLLVHGPSATPDDWFKFIKHPVKLTEEFFRQGNLRAAAIVCRRHKNEIVREITKDDVQSFMDFSSTADASVSDLITWMESFTPIIIMSRAFPEWVTWIVRKARTFETQSSGPWPEPALTFTEAAILALEDFSAHSYTIASVDRMHLDSFKVSPKSPMSELNVLFWSLTQIQTLKKKYSILIPYKCFSDAYESEEGSLKLIMKMLENICQTKLSALMNDYILPLFSGTPKDISSMISTYLDTTACEKNGIIDESRFIAFTNLISNPQDKLKAVNTILTWAVVPWSRDVEALANQALEINHPSVETVKQHFDTLPKKIIMRKYKFALRSSHDSRNFAQLALYIKRIYRLGKSSMVQDAIDLASSYAEKGRLLPYVCYFQRIIENGLPSNFKMDSLIENLEKKRRMEVLSSAWLSCKRNIKKPHVPELLSAIHSRLKTLDGKQDIQEVIGGKKSLRLEELGVQCGALQLCNARDISLTYANGLDLDETNIEKSHESVKKAEEVSCILRCPKELVWLELAIRCLEESKFKLAAFIIAKLEQVSGKDFSVKCGQRFLQLIYNIVLKCSLNGIIEPELVEVLSSSLMNTLVHGSYSCQELNLMLNLLKLLRIFEISKFKPIVYEYYQDQIEPQMIRLHQNIFVPIMSRLKDPLRDCDLDSLRSAIEQLIGEPETMTKDISTLEKLFHLSLLLSKLNLIDAESQKNLKVYTNQVVTYVLMNLLNSRRKVSRELAVALLNYFPVEKVGTWLWRIRSKQRFIADRSLAFNVNQVAIQFFSAHSNNLMSKDNAFATYERFRADHRKNFWELKGQLLGVPSKDCLLETLEGQTKLLARLVMLPNVKMNMLTKYCQDFGLSEDECYVQYLRHVILSWKPKYTAKKSEIVTIEDDTEKMSTKCLGIAKKIRSDHDFTVSLLNEVNTYFYEGIAVVIRISGALFNKNVSSWMIAINFLKGYTRQGSPSQEEMTAWYASHAGNVAFPEIGSYRLPLKSIPFQQSVLEAEVNLENYEKWLNAPPALHKFSRDAICSIAIHNLKTRETRQTGTWYLVHQQKDLLTQILECVKKISSLETSVACLYYTVNQVMAPGIDQVEAAQECYMKAQEWNNRDKTADSAGKLQKAEKKYLTVSTIHILHSYGLARDEYLQYASEPNQLIYLLYHDSSITECHASSSVGVRNVGAPDINAAVERIALLYEVDLTKIALELLSEWFEPPTYSDNTFNETTIVMSLERESVDCHDNSISIVRASYMLRGREDSSDVEKYLMAMAFPQDQENRTKPHAMRLKALKCLMSIRTVEQLERITSQKIDTIRNFATTLEILSGLEVCGVSFSFGSFERVEKTVIVNRLLSSPSNSSESVLLAARICLKYAIISRQIWDALLMKMMELGLCVKLKEILQTIGHSQASFGTIKKAWEFLLNSLFNDDKRRTSGDAYAKLLMDFVMSCPCRSYLNIPRIVESLKAVNREDLASLLI